MNRKTIILTGFMGTGKSTVGKLLAERLDRQFVDTDAVIEARCGKSIATLFRDDGEAAFRAWEARLAHELADSSDLVVATGGGFFTNPANVAALRPKTTILCLSATADAIFARLQHDTSRPLLAVPDPLARISELLTARAAVYNQFQQIDTTGKSAEQIVEEIIRVLQNEQTITVQHPTGSYPIHVGAGALQSLREMIGLDTPVAVISDSNVAPLYAEQVARQFGQATTIAVPAGEQHKTLETVRTLYDALLSAELDRKGCVIALGGGVVGDMAGFAAATFMRGVALVQCPTTLLAMVDASVGGKTGVDLPQGKNLVGAFKQPEAVVADLATLQTLPEVELAAGLAEVIKHGLIAQPALFELFETLPLSDAPLLNQLPAIGRIVTDAIQVKRDIVIEDPFEQGRRAVLNLGHTFGHAIEQVSGYTIRHGEGVAMGLAAAANLSARLGLADPALQQRIERALSAAKLPRRVPDHLNVDALMTAIRSDKKKARGAMRYIVLRDVGDVFVSADVPDDAVRATWRAMQAASTTG